MLKPDKGKLENKKGIHLLQELELKNQTPVRSLIKIQESNVVIG